MIPLILLHIALATLLLTGCSRGSAQGDKPPGEQPHPAILGHRGIHPIVARWYYESHPHAFDCRDDPHFKDGSGKANDYACESCPVGNPNRVIVISSRDKAYDVPAEINASFACHDINTLIPEPGSYVDSDVFICERSTQTGAVVVDGKKFVCDEDEVSNSVPLGDLAPGESKTVTIPFYVDGQKEKP